MKIMMAAEVLLNGLDPTKPHKVLDSNGRLASFPSSKKDEPSTVFPFLPTPSVQKETVEQSVMQELTLSEENYSTETASEVEPSQEPVTLEIGGDSMKDFNVGADASIKLDEAKLPELARPKGRPKGSSKKTS